ncbi:hypothetical protein [Streptomyces sp. NBC_01451]|uniref:hypothetical protein n=1 Tax=Streptomyces sp. NBC_01451 TaxID=2903872 RepID=UPI002E314F64|nr:hypothetical protein [Streptomyces sp. NBC_01451]
MTVRRIAVRIDRVVLDAGVAEGRSVAEIAEVLGSALREGLVVRQGVVAPAVTRTSFERLRVTSGGGGLDAVAQAASEAVGRAVADAAGSGPTIAAGSARGTARGGDPR